MTVSVIPLFPNISQFQAQEDFEREVAGRFGLVPNFFRSAPDAPLMVRDLWQFAKAAYLDNPIPAIFKERLFVYLSRFCEVRYCITRHCGFLLGLGRAAGDPHAPVMTTTQVIHLLRRPVPTDECAAMAFARLEALAAPIDWPTPETSHDDDLLTAATALFLQPARAERAKGALRIALGGEKFELLVGFLTFVRSAHYWTLMHPELEFEDDVKELMREHQVLAGLLLEDADAGRCEMGARLFEELEYLRNLNERHELEQARRALEESGRQKDLLIKEVDHRIKNSLQIVSSMLHMQAKAAGAASSQFHSAAARVAAIAAVHHQLHSFDNVGSVHLDRYLRDLCQGIAAAATNTDGTTSILVEADPLLISTDTAVPLGLIVNELITNAIQHAQPTGGGGRVHIALESHPDNFSISVCDPGDGPSGSHTAGLGTRLVESLARQIGATLTKGRAPAGYTVAVTVPRSGEQAGEV
jgi:two-component sensor histidine kinase